MAAKELSYCGNQVRRLDRDRYLTALFIPRGAREHVFALYAFNSEIAHARDVVSEPHLAAIRLQWWREAIAEIYGAEHARAQPIVEALSTAIRGCRLSQSHFQKLITAREADLEPKQPATLTLLEQHARNTGAPLSSLVLEVLGAGEGPAQAAAQSAGTAWALAGLLRAVPFHARAKRLYLPEDIMDEYGVSRRDLFELRPSGGLADVARLVADRAQAHVAAARKHRPDVPGQLRVGLLTATAASFYLRALRRTDYDVFRLPRSLPGLAPRLAWARLRGRY